MSAERGSTVMDRYIGTWQVDGTDHAAVFVSSTDENDVIQNDSQRSGVWALQRTKIWARIHGLDALPVREYHR